jgi:taurine dioxygenase
MSVYKHIEVKPLAGALGAQIEGVDLSRPPKPEVMAEIKQAFNKHLVIGFRDQKLTPAQQCDFARNWGRLTRHPFIKTMPDNPDVVAVIRLPDDTTLNFGGVWHADGTFVERPSLGSMLYAIEVPPAGGDTLFVNLYLAYEALSPGMQRLADSLIVMHSAANGYDPDRGATDPARSKVMQTGVGFEVTDNVKKEMPHPLVRIIPETGRKALWTAGGYCLRFADMTEDESKPLLEFFFEHVRNPNFSFRWNWAPGSLIFWDNRCTNHFAINDYRGYRREMHRVQIEGERPFGPAMPLDASPAGAERRAAAG